GADAASPGGAYDPLTDTWSPVSFTNVPPRVGGISDGGPTYLDGAKALVWRGKALYSRRYDLATDTWLPVSTTGEPAVAAFAPAHGFAGRTLVLWGARSPDNQTLVADGGRYDVE